MLGSPEFIKPNTADTKKETSPAYESNLIKIEKDCMAHMLPKREKDSTEKKADWIAGHANELRVIVDTIDKEESFEKLLAEDPEISSAFFEYVLNLPFSTEEKKDWAKEHFAEFVDLFQKNKEQFIKMYQEDPAELNALLKMILAEKH